MYLSTQEKLNKYFPLLIGIAIAVNATGLFNDILEPDGALYASVAKTIVQKNEWLNLYAVGKDWLDKPHLPFWLSALSYKVFGISAFAYKLPSFLCFLLGVIYTYKLAKKLYDTSTAQLATLIYTTALHVILSNFDVRAEGYLTAFIVASIYHFYCAMQSPWIKQIIAAAFFAALAIMTKGVFVLITIGAGFVIYWMASKQWKQFISIRWYLFVLFCFIFITPELYSLYHQFDLHPEKIVFDTTHVSGLKFFFWDSQFGRFFNTGPIQGEGDWLFFTHTILWAFLPWAVYLVIVCIKGLKNIFKPKTTPSLILSAGALVSFIIFSASKFQLPHYIVILFPQFSILVAGYLLSVNNETTLKKLNIMQSVFYWILPVLIIAIIIIFKIERVWLVSIFTVMTSIAFFITKNNKGVYGIVIKATCFSALLAFFLNFIFYPQLLQYQGGMLAGKWQQQHIPDSKITMYRCNQYGFEFYGNATPERQEQLQTVLLHRQNQFILSHKNEIEAVNTDSFNVKRIASFNYFHISALDAEFFNHKTRSAVLDTLIIADISRKY